MWNPFKKKRKKMIDQEKLFSMKEDFGRFEYYQWIKGEHAGAVTEYRDIAVDHDGGVFVEFVDGTRCRIEMVQDMMIRTNSKNDILDVDIQQQPQQIAQGSVSGNAKITAKQPESPLQALLKKQKPNPVNVDISIELNIPSPELYKVICGSFDNAEDEVVDYVVQGINMESIKAIIKEGLKKYYA